MTNEELAQRIHNGEADLILKLWEQIQKFATRQAYRMLQATDGRGGVSGEDLEQEAFIALLEAVQSWTQKEWKFLTWYVFYLKRHFRAASGFLTKHEQFDPIHNCRSLDEPIGNEDEDSFSLGDTISDPAAERVIEGIGESYDRKVFHGLVMSALETQEQRDLIELEYFQNIPREDAAKVLNLSVNKARKVHNNAIRELRHPRNRWWMKQYMQDF